MTRVARSSRLGGGLASLTLAAIAASQAAGCGDDTANEAPAFDGYAYASHHVELPAGRMHYVDEGAGTPVVMLHGVPVWSYVWRNIIPYVAGGHRAIAPDMLNHGKSDKNEHYAFLDHYANFEQLVDKLGLDQIVLVVEDWGSPIGFLYAARHPERVKGIVFFEAMLGPAPSLDGFPPAVQAMRGPEGYDLVVRQNFFFEQMLPQLVLHPLPPPVLGAYKAPFANESDRLQLLAWPNEIPVIGGDSPNLAPFGEYAQFLASSPIPKLLIHAEPGVLGTPAAVDFARKTYPNLTTVSIGDGLHVFEEDSPDAVGAAIRDWLATL